MRNKIVVVTGATSGIGEDCALKLAAAGATVILAARTPQKLDDTVAKIRGQGGKAFAYACDISSMADCDRFVKTVLDEHGHVDILINNAGRSIRRSVKFSFDRFHDFERTMQLNYFGALRLIFGFAPTMLERKSRPHHQHLVDRRARQPAALFGLRRVEGRARCLLVVCRARVRRRQRALHHRQHAAGAHADDRARPSCTTPSRRCRRTRPPSW